MAGTEDPAPADLVEHPLGLAYLDGLLALSASAGWNQDADDWRHLLAHGRGRALSTRDGTVVASTVVLPYPAPAGGFAWISMVLVLPGHRGRGHAGRLLAEALGWLGKRGLTPVLDATPAGHPVYRRAGFVDAWGFVRMQRGGAAPAGPGGAAPPAGTVVGPLRDVHRPARDALDALAFGASRGPLLRALAARLPRAAQVAVRDGAVVGHVLGRPGRVATQLGPLVAADDATAIALLDAALAGVDGPVFADVPDARVAIRDALERRGFVAQRPFTRLVHPGAGAVAPPAPGDASRIALVAGPELG